MLAVVFIPQKYGFPVQKYIGVLCNFCGGVANKKPSDNPRALQNQGIVRV
jgi:hypothetical protein